MAVDAEKRGMEHRRRSSPPADSPSAPAAVRTAMENEARLSAETRRFDRRSDNQLLRRRARSPSVGQESAGMPNLICTSLTAARAEGAELAVDLADIIALARQSSFCSSMICL